METDEDKENGGIVKCRGGGGGGDGKGEECGIEKGEKARGGGEIREDEVENEKYLELV